MQHVVIQRAESRRRKREFLARVEQASDETLCTWLENLDGAEELSAFGSWQLRAICAQLELRP